MAKAGLSEPILKCAWHDSLSSENLQLGRCRVVVVGVGEVGGNTLTWLMDMCVKGTECITVNAGAFHLGDSKVHKGVLMGEKFTREFGVGDNSELGWAITEESGKRLEELLSNACVVFVIAGLGGETGSDVAPVIAEIAKRKGAITVGVVTISFCAEKNRMERTALALTEMRRHCDTVVVIDGGQLPANKASKAAGQVLASVVKCMIEMVSTSSFINRDLADFKTVIKRGGVAVVGIGESDKPNRVEEAVKNALRSPLLDVDYAGASGVLIHVAGDCQMTIEEVNRAGEMVAEVMGDNALVIGGAGVNPEQNGKLKVTLIMTGVRLPQILSGFGAIAPQLFNMEPYAEPEKPLGIELNLYQMENF